MTYDPIFKFCLPCLWHLHLQISGDYNAEIDAHADALAEDLLQGFGLDEAVAEDNEENTAKESEDDKKERHGHHADVNNVKEFNKNLNEQIKKDNEKLNKANDEVKSGCGAMKVSTAMVIVMFLSIIWKEIIF